jgi:hypothetical protein
MLLWEKLHAIPKANFVENETIGDIRSDKERLIEKARQLLQSMYLVAFKISMWFKGNYSVAAWVALVGGSFLFLVFGYAGTVFENDLLTLTGFAILTVCLIISKWKFYTFNNPDFVRRTINWATLSVWIAALCAIITFFLLASTFYEFSGIITHSLIFVLLTGAFILLVTSLVFGYVKSTLAPCMSCRKCWTTKDNHGFCHVCGEAEARHRQENERLAVAAAEAERQRRQAEWERECAERRQRLEHETVTMDYLIELSPVNFEDTVGMMFEQHGYIVRKTPVTGDNGVDLILEKNGRREIVQCKRWNDAVGIEEVQRLCGCLHDRQLKPTRAWLVTTARFTASARRFARGIDNLMLIDGTALVRMMTKAGYRDMDR